MDGAVFPQPLWSGEQEESLGIQGLSRRKLQTADGKPPSARHQQVFGVH